MSTDAVDQTIDELRAALAALESQQPGEPELSPDEELEPDGEDEQEPEDEPEPEDSAVGRCEDATLVGGTLYQCALQDGHEGEHSFQVASENEPPAEDSEKRMRQANERLNRENERHWNRIQEIMGPDAAQLVPCELCFELTPGFRWDAAPNEAKAAAVRIAIGLPDVSNYAPSATERMCDDCRGLGKARTGSMVPGQETARCDACGGTGFVATRPRLNAAEDALAAPDAESNVVPFPDDGVERDMFGTPATDPDYGKMPNMRARPVDYWATNRV